jgi:cis-3-alkyl-4-acyloxetan-2-one decarboxylase
MTRLAELLREQREPLLHVSVDTAPEGVRSPPTVVLIHGIASSSTTFDYVVPLIADTHRVVAIDLLGFGQSPAPDDAEYTLEEHVAAIAHTLRHLRLDSFVLVGHSLGCLIATRYAATHPRAVARMVLVSPPVYQSPAEIGDDRVKRRMTGYLAAYRFFRENQSFTVSNAARVARLLPIAHVMEITEANWTPFVKSLQNCIETQTVIGDLARIDVPVDIVYGRFDEFIVPESVAILSRMRGVTTHRVEANDHLIRRSMARVVAAAIATDAAGA